jgi:hypothetical protein
VKKRKTSILFIIIKLLRMVDSVIVNNAKDRMTKKIIKSIDRIDYINKYCTGRTILRQLDCGEKIMLKG